MINYSLVGLEDVLDELRLIFLSQEFSDLHDLMFPGSDFPVHQLEAVFICEKFGTPATFPTLEIVGSRSNNANPSSNVIDLLHEVTLYYHERDDDEELLERRVMRFLKATRLYFREHQYLERLDVGPIQLGDDNYAPFVPQGANDGRPFIKTGSFDLRMESLG